jgi:hypothetical protein
MGIAAFVAFGAGAIGPDQRIGQWYVEVYFTFGWWANVLVMI